LSSNPAITRKGYLTFWKLGPPNLFPLLFAFPASRQIVVCVQLVS
jgi:hypothetical protein